ncbi:hypothetical protein M404DRAFT_188930 [Pisolithus tinctorius Marx 270]|uniref:Uncharacterized protein n=1 Tax=Pisolithus tinctorius Marx 270 TaxID=870435 RepID=A0A0C3KZB7_PISTI|nr:hypothetical protein M404DRAFT_188930 [Pisolithus tinctorius Marx 270]
MTSVHLPMHLFGKVRCPGGVGGFEHLYIPGFLDRALQTREWRPPKFLNHNLHPTNLSMYSTQPTSNWSVDVSRERSYLCNKLILSGNICRMMCY